jgi:hypothetical protein
MNRVQIPRLKHGPSAGLWPIFAARKRPLCRYFQCRREFSHGPGRVRDPLKIRCTPIFWDISRIRPFEKWPKSSSGQLLDGTSEWRGPTAGVNIFPASSRSRKRSGGLKSKRRRGCRSVAVHPKHSVVLRPHNRSATDTEAAHVHLQTRLLRPVQSTALQFSK